LLLLLQVAVIGAGYIAVELAGVFQALHTDTTLVIRKEQAMGKLDAMLREELHNSMELAGITLQRNSSTEVSCYKLACISC
jgi:glutathione reductase (NADPH)